MRQPRLQRAMGWPNAAAAVPLGAPGGPGHHSQPKEVDNRANKTYKRLSVHPCMCRLEGRATCSR